MCQSIPETDFYAVSGKFIVLIIILFLNLSIINPASGRFGKLIGTFGFPSWEEGKYYRSSWNGYTEWLKILHRYHIHYARFWLLPWRGNIHWFYPWRIANGDKSTPPERRIYNLFEFNEDYFTNLKKFALVAVKLNITLNLIVFDDCHLRHSPDRKINPEYHNIQQIRSRNDWYKKPVANIAARNFWKKVFDALKRYPHIIYTVCNENYDFPEWQEEMARYMAKDIVPLDTGSSTITPQSRWLYRFVSIHGQVTPQSILRHKRQENIIFSSDGGRFARKDYNLINECVRAGVKQGAGYELYLDSAYGWNLKEILLRLGNESRKVLGD